jgi:hypothetical protein
MDLRIRPLRDSANSNYRPMLRVEFTNERVVLETDDPPRVLEFDREEFSAVLQIAEEVRRAKAEQ